MWNNFTIFEHNLHLKHYCFWLIYIIQVNQWLSTCRHVGNWIWNRIGYHGHTTFTLLLDRPTKVVRKYDDVSISTRTRHPFASPTPSATHRIEIIPSIVCRRHQRVCVRACVRACVTRQCTVCSRWASTQTDERPGVYWWYRWGLNGLRSLEQRNPSCCSRTKISCAG